MPESLPPDMRLAGEPGRWTIELVGGDRIFLLADGYSVEGGEYVFSLLMEGEPPFLIDTARLPQSIVRSVESGWESAPS